MRIPKVSVVWRAMTAAVTMSVVLAGVARAGEPIVVDSCDDPATWKVITAEGVELKVHADDAPSGRCLRLDFNFVTGGGYCIVQRDFARALPENFEFTARLRGDAPANNLEFKLLDIEPGEHGTPESESVWWVNKRRFEFPREWTTLRYKARRFEFAWGPNHTLRPENVSRIQFAIASAEGGRGSVWLDDVTFRELPPTNPNPPAMRATASSTHRMVSLVQRVLNVKHAGQGPFEAWQPAPQDRSPIVTIDFGGTREFGGVEIEWETPPKSVRVETSSVGVGENARWEIVGTYADLLANSTTRTPMQDGEAEGVRLVMELGETRPSIRAIRVREPDYGVSMNAFWASVARDVPAGTLPAACSGVQTYWTVLGAPEHENEALIATDGRIEAFKLGPSLQPVLFVEEGPDEGKRAHMVAFHPQAATLAEGHLPIASVTLASDEGDTIHIEAFVTPHATTPVLMARYEFEMAARDHAVVTPALALRPFQVNPPWQFLNNPGGAAKVSSIEREGDDEFRVNVEDSHQGWAFRVSPPPDQVVMRALASGEVGVEPPTSVEHSSTSTHDQLGAASLAAMWRRRTSRVGAFEVYITVPMVAGGESRAITANEYIAARNEMSAAWKDRIEQVKFIVPESAQPLVDTAYSQLAFILINRDGPAIQPGSRSYERSWIRDGCLTSAALHAFGFHNETREFLEWYADHLFESGKVPCVVDRRGPEPVTENDSHGEFIFAILDDYQYTRDKAFLERMFPKVRKVVGHIESIRATRLTPEFESDATRQEPGKPAVPVRAFRGLVPESISHEGYSSKPMHSYWDDFFTLRGLRDAARIADLVGEKETAGAWNTFADDFEKDLTASIQLVQAAHGIDYVPGCVELGDFDSTSTTIAVWPCDAVNETLRPSYLRTFDRYWDNFTEREASSTWDAYTPYELRHVGSLVRLGERVRANRVLGWYMGHQRPPGFRHWAEVVFRDADTPRFIGDMPHTWCGSDYLNSFRSMFVYEKNESRADGSLVLFAGVPHEWASNEDGVGFTELSTHFGVLSANYADATGDRAVVTVFSKNGVSPPGGLELALPHPSPPRSVLVDGEERDATRPIVIGSIPSGNSVRVEIRY
ncbi:MAG: hypothetical protein IPK69_12965 [Phycisphaerales bacterium]|nr:MAG: hypothetical protein IPK69_12965 [Phycisphaerales bacterium]